MAKLPATKHNLLKAFRKHKACYNSLQGNHECCRRLILFYAVEVGLKVLLLDRIHKHNLDDLLSHEKYKKLRDDGHNIMEMLKLANLQGQYKLCTFESANGIQVQSSEYHQLWRYGIDAKKASDEQNAEMTLQNIIEFLSTKL